MAIMHPTFKDIGRLRFKPTEGECTLHMFLSEVLDDTYEVYFQPNLNGMRPDFVVLRRGTGAMIIEVKDWKIDHYEILEDDSWKERQELSDRVDLRRLKSPFNQVKMYKDSMYDLHIEGLQDQNIKNPKLYAVVSTLLYFHNATKEQLHKKSPRNAGISGNPKKRASDHTIVMGSDCLEKEKFESILKECRMNRQSMLFTDDLYVKFKMLLQPSIHYAHEGRDITYSENQARIIDSHARTSQKIKGVAGSGKTIALARRAVNAQKRHGGDVLILTFNITLINYIRHRMNDVAAEFTWNSFTIVNYHQFILARRANVDDWDGDQDCPKPQSYDKYETIIIDEIQDFKEEWIRNIRMYLRDGGELVVFGDEKQNIYSMTLEDRKPWTGIPGAWNVLKWSFRMTTKLALLAHQFQMRYFNTRYDLDDIEYQRDLFDSSSIEYYRHDSFDVQSVYEVIVNSMVKHDLTESDVCILSGKIQNIRALDTHISRHSVNTLTTFESDEIFQAIERQCTIGGKLDEVRLKDRLKKYRRQKKLHFQMNGVGMKLSTIHSFKGWETDTLVLLLDGLGSNTEAEDELIYTAITRCKRHLIVINVSNSKYHEFFTQAVVAD